MSSQRLVRLRAVPRLLSIAALSTILSACIAVPIPVHQSAGAIPSYRSNIDEERTSKIVEGVTTRREVLLELGQPDGRAVDDHWFTYQSIARRGGTHWAIAIMTQNKGGIESIDDWDTARRVTIRFDDHGVVANIAVEQKNCTTWATDYPDCPSPAGVDLRVADEEERGKQLLASSGLELTRLQPGEHESLIMLYRESAPDCEIKHPLRPDLENLHIVSAFVVTERRLLWRESYSHHWDFQALEDISEVKPLRGFFTRLQVLIADGSCLVFTMDYPYVTGDQLLKAVTRAHEQPHQFQTRDHPDATRD